MSDQLSVDQPVADIGFSVDLPAADIELVSVVDEPVSDVMLSNDADEPVVDIKLASVVDEPMDIKPSDVVDEPVCGARDVSSATIKHCARFRRAREDAEVEMEQAERLHEQISIVQLC